MLKRCGLALLSLFLFAGQIAPENFPVYVGGLTLATTPLTGGEQVYLLQNGASRRTAVSNILASSSAFDGVFGSTRGSIIERGAGNWQGIVPGAAGLPWISNGGGLDPAYQALTSPNVNFTQFGSGAILRSLDQKLKGDVTVSLADFGASQSTQSTTGTMTAGSSTLTLTAPIDFANGQAIRVNHAGAVFALNPPTAPAVANIGAAGATTYTYTIASVDSLGGVGAAIATFTTTTGNATLNTTNFNQITWTAATGTAPAAYAVYGRIGGSLQLLGFALSTTFNDQGQPLGTAVVIDWLPNTPPASALADWLLTTISSGGGTSTLILSANAITTATTQPIDHDDSSALANAINALPAAGGRILMKPGASSCLTTPLNFANGTTSVQSTFAGVHLVSTGAHIGFGSAPQTNLVWCGGPTIGAMIVVAGPVKGHGLENIVLNCNNLAGTALKQSAASYGDYNNVETSGCFNQGIQLTSLTTAPANSSPNTQFNQFWKTSFFTAVSPNPGIINPSCLTLDGDGVDNLTDSNFNYFINSSCVLATSNQTQGALFIRCADTNFIWGLAVFGGGTGSAMVNFDYTATGCGSIYPSGNQLRGVDVSGQASFPGVQVNNLGTPNSAARANMLDGISQVNGATCPILANLFCMSPTQIVWGANGNNVGQDLLGVWTAFTPAPSCGTATFTVNTARAKTMGKTTWITVDITVSTLGTCTTGVSPAFSFNLPNTANGVSELTGREFNNNSGMVGCTLNASVAVLTCVKQATALVNWVAGDRMILSAVYENQ